MLLVWMLPTLKFFSKRWCCGKGGKGGEIWFQAAHCDSALACGVAWGLQPPGTSLTDTMSPVCTGDPAVCLCSSSVSALYSQERQTPVKVFPLKVQTSRSFLGGRDPPLGTHSHSPQSRARGLDWVRVCVQVHTEYFEYRINLQWDTSFHNSSGGDCVNIKLSTLLTYRKLQIQKSTFHCLYTSYRNLVNTISTWNLESEWANSKFMGWQKQKYGRLVSQNNLSRPQSQFAQHGVADWVI